MGKLVGDRLCSARIPLIWSGSIRPAWHGGEDHQLVISVMVHIIELHGSCGCLPIPELESGTLLRREVAQSRRDRRVGAGGILGFWDPGFELNAWYRQAICGISSP